jgi:hypothetical protein
MTADDAHAETEELQFDRVVSDAALEEQSSQRPPVTCTGCSTPIHTECYMRGRGRDLTMWRW